MELLYSVRPLRSQRQKVLPLDKAVPPLPGRARQPIDFACLPSFRGVPRNRWTASLVLRACPLSQNAAPQVTPITASLRTRGVNLLRKADGKKDAFSHLLNERGGGYRGFSHSHHTTSQSRSTSGPLFSDPSFLQKQV